jgi:protein-L-isoaspartate O-methyltransferase
VPVVDRGHAGLDVIEDLRDDEALYSSADHASGGGAAQIVSTELDGGAFDDALDGRMTVADIGAGTGAMTMVTARWLGPRGRVYSTDINEAQVHAIADQVTRAGLTNVVTVIGARLG